MGMSQPKYKKRDKVIVRRGGHRHEGRVVEVHGRGVVVETDDNNKRDFYYWSDVLGYAVSDERIETRLKSSGRTGLASLGDVIELPNPKSQPAAEVLKERANHIANVKTVEQAPKRLAIDSSGDPEKATRALEEFGRAHEKRKRVAKKSRIAKAHEPTLIGSRMRAERLKRNIKQDEFAKKLGITSKLLSEIELGDEKPSDDLLLAFAEACHVSLDELISLRDRTTWYEPNVAPPSVEPVETEVPKSLPPAAIPPTDTTAVEAPGGVAWSTAPSARSKEFRLIIEGPHEGLMNILAEAQELGLRTKLERK